MFEVYQCSACLLRQHEACEGDRVPGHRDCECQCGLKCCTYCADGEHEKCEPRVNPDCSLEDGHWKASTCSCDVCWCAEDEKTPYNPGGLYSGTPSGEAWTFHVKHLQEGW